MTQWCEEQMKRLSGHEDMTLIHFCMSLDGPAEIRLQLREILVRIIDGLFLCLVARHTSQPFRNPHSAVLVD